MALSRQSRNPTLNPSVSFRSTDRRKMDCIARAHTHGLPKHARRVRSAARTAGKWIALRAHTHTGCRSTPCGHRRGGASPGSHRYRPCDSSRAAKTLTVSSTWPG
jgi:hypothetical protein